MRLSSYLLPLLIFTTGCMGIFPSTHTADMQNVAAKPPRFLVARKVPTKLFLVLNPANVPDSYSVKSQRRNITLNISSFQLFVKRDLKEAMAEEFAEVEVVSPAAKLPETPHVVADVKINNLELVDQAISGAVTVVSTRLVMSWSFAVRTSDSHDYLFSFAGISSSSDTSNGAEDFVAQTVREALAGLLGKWGKADVMSKLMTWSEEAKTPR